MNRRHSIAGALLVPALLLAACTDDADADGEQAAGKVAGESAETPAGDVVPEDVADWSDEQLTDLYHSAFSNVAAVDSVEIRARIDGDGPGAGDITMLVDYERDRCRMLQKSGRTRLESVVLPENDEAWRLGNRAYYAADGTVTPAERQQSGVWVKMLEKNAKTLECTAAGKEPNPEVEVEVEYVGVETVDDVETIHLTSNEMPEVWVAYQEGEPMAVRFARQGGTVTYGRFNERFDIEPPEEFIDTQEVLDRIQKQIGETDDLIESLEKAKEEFE